MASRYTYYVAVFFHKKVEQEGESYILTDIRYVTKVDHTTKDAYWTVGVEALKFSNLTVAEDLVFGLTANGFDANVIIKPSFYEVRNRKDVE